MDVSPRALDELARIALDDPDPEVRSTAVGVLERLGGPGGGTGRAPVDAERREASGTLGERLVSRLDDERYPQQLAPLRDLSEDEFRALLDRLVGRLVDRDRDEQALSVAVERIDRVVREWHADGRPAALANLTPTVRDARAAGRRNAVGAALTFVELGQVVEAALGHLIDDPGQRRDMLTVLRDDAGRVDLTPLRRLDLRAMRLARLITPAGLEVRGEFDDEAEFDDDEDEEVESDDLADEDESDDLADEDEDEDEDDYDEDDYESDDEPATAPPGDDGPPATRTAYPLLAAPDRVAVEAWFDLRVGLAASEEPGVVAPEPLTLPAGEVDVTVSLNVSGFRVEDGAGPTFVLHVTRDQRYPVRTLRLSALQGAELAALRTVQASFHVGGNLIGTAYRRIRVLTGDPAVDEAPDGTPAPAAGTVTSWSLDPDRQADLVLLVTTTNTVAQDELEWTVSLPGEDVRPIVTRRVGSGTADWARTTYRTIDSGTADAELTLTNLSRTVAGAVPDEVWTALRSAGAAPRVLLATDEPYIPWELAELPGGFGAEEGTVLGGYAAVGRWVTNIGRNQSKAPAATVLSATMSAVSGTYPSNDLPSARAEAARLVADYGAVAVDARKPAVLALLRGDPPADVVHFAIHGVFDQFDIQDGMLLADGTNLSASEVGGVRHFAGRVVFLNACQLGRGNETLGQTAGMAAAFLGLGAQAVVAPLWKVNDGEAYAVGTEFYRAVLAGTSPAEFFRQQRQAGLGHESEPVGTRLAYLYFGHPQLRVDWRGAAPHEEPTA